MQPNNLERYLMNDIKLLHKPQWTLVGTDWHMIIGNRSVAHLIPVFSPHVPQYKWLSVIEYREYNDHGWHAVDFETLDIAKYDIEQWWFHMCRGEKFRPNG